MLLGPQEMARRIEYKHRPGWLVWFGRYTRQYWAMACWVRTPHAMLRADTPEALDAAIVTFEMLFSKPLPPHEPGSSAGPKPPL
jgi:hypothetical protein